ncbi:DNA polymerase III, partial [bacterium]|nr:DNA polymerase III [bacterium]
MRLADAERYVQPLVEYLTQAKGLERIEIAGSYRRRCETVGDIDLLAISEEPDDVMERFTSYPGVR